MYSSLYSITSLYSIDCPALYISTVWTLGFIKLTQCFSLSREHKSLFQRKGLVLKESHSLMRTEPDPAGLKK